MLLVNSALLILNIRPLGYERVYLPLCQVADTPFHIQGDDFFSFLFTFNVELRCISPLSLEALKKTKRPKVFFSI